jgi:ubiquinone/menaquinone biosynthesis C-methylase UbiE
MKKHLLGAAILSVALGAVPGAQQRQHNRLFPPADLGLLEGPDRDAWQRPDQIMDALRISEGSVVADLGAGGGWFTIRLARRVGPNGRVYAEDIQPQMIEAIARRVAREGLKDRVQPLLGTANDPKLKVPVDAVLIVDAFHEMEQPTVLLHNVALALKPNGRLGIVEFKQDGGGPGPLMSERVEPERVVRNAQEAGLRVCSVETFLRYQYMLVFVRADGDPVEQGCTGPTSPGGASSAARD